MSKIFDKIETRFEEGPHAIQPKSIVPIIGEPDIDESYIRQQDVVLLTTLLIDRTLTALNGGSPVNIKWAVDDYAQEYPDRTGYGCEDQKFPPSAARRFAEIISWNIWQMDGIVMDWETGKPVLFMLPFEFKPIKG